MPSDYPVQFTVDYPDRQLDRLSSAFRIFTVIPIAIVLGALGSGSFGWGDSSWSDNGSSTSSHSAMGGVGLLVLPPLLMILFRQKYPRWWFDWNYNVMSFTNRVCVYGLLMTDVYPATDEEQSSHLELPYPDVQSDLNRWLPLVKWLLAIPHYIVLFFLFVGVFVAAVIAWFAILFTGRFPKGLFDYIAGVLRWGNRVVAYAFVLTTDAYPPFSLSA
jgi:Domain of unknown function (DUF4389)